MTLADRATIGNMGPEYGATLRILPRRRRNHQVPDHVGPRGKPASSWSRPIPRRRACGAIAAPPIRSSPTHSTSTCQRSCRRWLVPKRPEGRIALENIATGFAKSLEDEYKKPGQLDTRYQVEGQDYDLGHGDVAIAAITSCTNTSNPSVLIGAGLLARNAVAKGLKTKPWVKTSLGAGQPGGGGVSVEIRPAGRSRQARLQPGRLRLHHLQSAIPGPLPAPGLQDHQRQGPDRGPACSRATATSRAGSRRTSRPTTWLRRRWWWPMRWRARCRRT